MNAQSASLNSPAARLAFQSYAGIGVLVFLVMMLAGALMRMTHGKWIDLPPNVFYQIMTLHGAGMVGTAGLAGAAVMWYFLRKYVNLSTGIFVAMLLLSLVGVVMILVAIGVGRIRGRVDFPLPVACEKHGSMEQPCGRWVHRWIGFHRRGVLAVLSRLRRRHY